MSERGFERSNQMYRFYGWEKADITDESGRTPRDYYDLLSKIWCAATCTPRLREKWTTENPTLGQCSVTAFLMRRPKRLICSLWMQTE